MLLTQRNLKVNLSRSINLVSNLQMQTKNNIFNVVCKLKVMHEDYKSNCCVLWYLPETGKRDDSFVKPPSGNKVFPDWIGGIISPGRLEMGRQEINQKL